MVGAVVGLALGIVGSVTTDLPLAPESVWCSARLPAGLAAGQHVALDWPFTPRRDSVA